jgi:hypothetical protein
MGRGQWALIPRAVQRRRAQEGPLRKQAHGVREGDLMMLKGQIVPDDERSSESCLRREINDLVREHVEDQEKFDLVALPENLGLRPCRYRA